MVDAIGRIAGLFVYPIKGCAAVALAESVVEPWGLAHDRRLAIATPDGRILTQREHPELARIRCSLAPGGELRVQVEDAAYALPQTVAMRTEARIWGDVVAAARLEGPLAEALATFLGRDVQLLRFPETTVRPCDPTYAPAGAATAFADGFPLLVANEATLVRLDEALVERGGEPVPMNRFRPNVVVADVPAGAEDDHERLDVAGGLVLDLVKPCTRCTVTTVDQETGEVHGEQPLALLRQTRRHPVLRQPVFGQNAVPRLPAGGRATVRVGDVAVLRGSARALRV